MAYRRKPEEAVPILQDWLTKTKARVLTKYSKMEQFQKIELRLQEMKELLPKLKRWEEYLMKELNIIEKDTNDDIFYVEVDDASKLEKINEKLKLIDEKLEGFNKAIKEMTLPPIDQRAQMLQQQEPLVAQARQLSVDWIRLNVEEKVLGSTAMATFQASYDNLDRPSKLCLLCFSIFPDNSVIKKRPLINWWIAENFITDVVDDQGKVKTTTDEVGEDIFQNLITAGLIQKVHKNSCKMHPWIRRMLISVASEAEFFDFDSTGALVNDSSRSHRACLVSGSGGPKEKELITLFNVNEQYLNLKAVWFSKLEKLVILQLGRWQTSAARHLEVENDEFLNHLGALKQLKYLSLHGISRITKLPSTLVGLTNLEILELRACHNLENLPSDIAPLRKLTHLDLSECYLLDGMPLGLEKLHSLRVLKGFLIGRPWNTECRFADLAQLKNLRKLSLCIGKDASAGELDLDRLEYISSLRILAITWERVPSASEIKGEQHSSKTDEVPSTSVHKAEQSSRTEDSTKAPADTPKWKKKFCFPLKLNKKDLRGLPCWPAREETSASENKDGLQHKTASSPLEDHVELKWNISFPPLLEKLDLWCLPYWLDSLNPAKLQNLKRLYIRGGKLDSIPNWEEAKWNVKTLRLKYLNNLKVDVDTLRKEFPELEYLEKVQCKDDKDLEWTKAEGLRILNGRKLTG